jgi:hypothetical protein
MTMNPTGIRPGHRTAVDQCRCVTAERDVVVNGSMSLDGFIAGPGDAMNWIFDFIAPDAFPEFALATGAMLSGTADLRVGKRQRDAGELVVTEYGGRWARPLRVLHDRAPAPAHTFLTGAIGASGPNGGRQEPGDHRR